MKRGLVMVVSNGGLEGNIDRWSYIVGVLKDAMFKYPAWGLKFDEARMSLEKSIEECKDKNSCFVTPEEQHLEYIAKGIEKRIIQLIHYPLYDWVVISILNMFQAYREMAEQARNNKDVLTKIRTSVNKSARIAMFQVFHPSKELAKQVLRILTKDTNLFDNWVVYGYYGVEFLEEADSDARMHLLITYDTDITLSFRNCFEHIVSALPPCGTYVWKKGKGGYTLTEYLSVTPGRKWKFDGDLLPRFAFNEGEFEEDLVRGVQGLVRNCGKEMFNHFVFRGGYFTDYIITARVENTRTIVFI